MIVAYCNTQVWHIFYFNLISESHPCWSSEVDDVINNRMGEFNHDL